MADLSPEPDSMADTDEGHSRSSYGGPPRWVKVFGLIALAVVVLFIVLVLTGGGGHGPGRHGGGGSDEIAPSTSTLHTRPEGGHAP